MSSLPFTPSVKKSAPKKPFVRLLPLTMGLTFSVLVLKVFSIPGHIQQWREGQETPRPVLAKLTPTPQARDVRGYERASSSVPQYFHQVQQPSNEPSPSETGSFTIDTLNEEEFQVLMNLNKERDKLNKEQQSFKEKELLLKALQEKIKKNAVENQKKNKEDKKNQARSHEDQEKMVVTLVKAYEGMKPRIAAQLLQEMDTTMVMMIVPKLKPAKLTPIMMAMDPEAARQLTRKLVELGIDPKTESHPKTGTPSPPQGQGL